MQIISATWHQTVIPPRLPVSVFRERQPCVYHQTSSKHRKSGGWWGGAGSKCLPDGALNFIKLTQPQQGELVDRYLATAGFWPLSPWPSSWPCTSMEFYWVTSLELEADTDTTCLPTNKQDFLKHQIARNVTIK